MKTAKEYKDSLRSRNIKVYLKGQLLNPETLIDHPFIRGHVNSAAMTYALAGMKEYEDLMTATSHLTGKKTNRFTHIHQSTEDLVKKVKMLCMISQKTGTCYQRCVGFDAMNATYSVTYEIDQAMGTNYHERFKKYLEYVQENDLMIAVVCMLPLAMKLLKDFESQQKLGLDPVFAPDKFNFPGTELWREIRDKFKAGELKN